MRFEIEHTLPTDPVAVAEALLDADFQASLADIGALKERRLLSQETSADGTVTRRIRCVLDVTISGMAKTLVGDGEPAWVEDATWDPDAMRWDWKIQPEMGKDLLAAGGTVEIRPDGDHAKRVVTGTVEVRVPLYGGKVEGWVVDGLRAAYEEEADRLERWLDGARSR